MREHILETGCTSGKDEYGVEVREGFLKTRDELGGEDILTTGEGKSVSEYS